MKQRTRSAAETQALASTFARQLRKGDIVALYGDLGSGKTQFAKGLCAFFGVREHVTSPTFVLLNRYSGKDAAGKELLIFHFDLYRIKSLSEIYDLGYEEFFSQDGICMIEWGEHLKDLLPLQRYDVRISFGGVEEERIIETEKYDSSGRLLTTTMQYTQ
ncbi:MAG: tRNA (adenosine(37)-N6)-threonylcarbamoyltransferase complex ATPase subunit type 1 TsaE [Ignavibacteriales bacterium]|nr:tRNA (adenosine(37)-N6)-threonylcarbamoyltransferase complex ATPase subunit type 1 TsaE [Ignavibacteriales bacterium]